MANCNKKVNQLTVGGCVDGSSLGIRLGCPDLLGTSEGNRLGWKDTLGISLGVTVGQSETDGFSEGCYDDYNIYNKIEQILRSMKTH